MKKVFQRGFTLIELLVVIAIIGILAAVVIGSLNDARSSGQDASIQQSMANIRAQAELVYNDNANYSYQTVCSDPRITNLINASLDVINGTQYVVGTHGIDTSIPNNGVVEADRRAACQDNDVAYAVVTPVAGGVGYWCVDSTGFSGSSTIAAASSFVCS